MSFMNSHMIQPIRVLQVFSIMDRGGAETMAMNYYRQIDRAQVQFDFLVHRLQRGAYDDEIEAMGGRIYRIPPIYNIIAHRKAIKCFFREHKDYSVIHGHVGELGYYIYKEAKQCNIPCIIAHSHNSSCDSDWKKPLRQILKYLMRPYITTAMSCGMEAANWMFGKKLASKAMMLNNAIDAKKYAFSPERRSIIRTKMRWQDQYIIGDVARFFPQKNHLFLIRLFASVVQKQENARLVLVGAKDGELFNKVQGLAHELGIADQVEFLGARDDVPDLLQGMDVYCSPSRYEGLSVSMVEAQASGLRVITSNKVPEQVRLVPELMEFLPLSASVDTWVDALLAPYERRNTFQEISQAGFDIMQNARWLQDFYLTQSLTTAQER